MRDWRGLAAQNNAEWCDVVARSHGLEPRFEDGAWTSATRTPPLYPDAVTLVDTVDARDLLARIDAASGCSVKDSFCSLDLAPHGFSVLFDARWIVRTPSSSAPTHAWGVVREAGAFSAWETAWRGDDGPVDLLLPTLLDTDSIVIAAAWEGDQIVAGAVFKRSAEVVGLSNLFAAACSPAEAWAGAIAFAVATFSGTPLVGYESGNELDHARAAGFEDAGPLRVWII